MHGAKERAVLAYLLAHLGRSVSHDEIVDAVWGDRLPSSAVRSLHARISRLRRLLEPGRTAASASVIARDGAGYRLAIGSDDVDGERFARLVAEARSDEPRESLAKAENALALLRGEPYGEFLYLDFAQVEVRRLKELELQARELRVAALLEFGLHGEAPPIGSERARLRLLSLPAHPFRVRRTRSSGRARRIRAVTNTVPAVSSPRVAE